MVLQALEFWLCSGLFLFSSVVGCGNLPPPEPGEGGLTLSQPNTTVNSTAVYRCQVSGYLLVGDAERTCQSNATWNGSEPTCLCKWQLEDLTL